MNKHTHNEWIARAKQRMKEMGITQEKLGEELSVTRMTISHYMTGRRQPSFEQIDLIAALLKMESAELLYGTSQDRTHIPIISWQEISNYNPKKIQTTKEASKELIPYFNPENPDCYALRTYGDAMFSPLSSTKSFREGDIIVVDPSHALSDNCFVIALLPGNEATFRQYVKESGTHYLKPVNQQFPMVKIDKKIKIVGVVIAQLNILA